MIEVAIIEDEISGQELIKTYLSKYFPDSTVIAVIDNVAEAKRELQHLKVDLVFMDIQLKGGNSFDLLKELKRIDFEIIFITAHGDFAIQAIRNNALDYLMKPINTTEFKVAVSKAIERISEKSIKIKPAETSLMFSTHSGLEFVDTSEIVFFEAEGAYTRVFTTTGDLLISRNIGDVEMDLNKSQFYRCHHSFIVNIKKIDKFLKRRNGVLIMKTGHNIPVSQRKVKEFITLLKISDK